MGTHQFALCCTSTLNFTSTFSAKLYFDQNCTSICTSRPIRSPDLTKGRSTKVEVRESKERGRSAEKVELMRTQNNGHLGTVWCEKYG